MHVEGTKSAIVQWVLTRKEDMAKEISLDDLVGDKDTKLVSPKKTKNKKQTKGEDMKTIKKTIILTIISTVAVIGFIGGVFFAGMKFETHRQNQIKQEASELVGTLKQ